MKNSKRIVRFGGRMAVIKKQAALDWEDLAVLQVRRAKEPFLGPVALLADFYYDNKRADLDENLLKDMIQVKKNDKPCIGLIKDDNQIKEHRTRWHFDPKNPRVVFKLVEILPEA